MDIGTPARLHPIFPSTHWILLLNQEYDLFEMLGTSQLEVVALLVFLLCEDRGLDPPLARVLCGLTVFESISCQVQMKKTSARRLLFDSGYRYIFRFKAWSSRKEDICRTGASTFHIWGKFRTGVIIMSVSYFWIIVYKGKGGVC